MQAEVTTYVSSFWTFATGLMIVGDGAAFLFAPISIAILGGTTPAEGPKASAMINLGTQLGGSIGVALLAVVIDQRMEFQSAILAGEDTTARPAVQVFLTHGGSLAKLSEMIAAQSAVLSYADATLVVAAISCLCIPLVFLMRKPKGLNGPVEFVG